MIGWVVLAWRWFDEVHNGNNPNWDELGGASSE